MPPRAIKPPIAGPPAALAALALFAAACAHSPFVPPLTAPAAGGAAWVEASSRHYVVRTDLGAAAARRLCDELERIEAAFADLVSFTPIEPAGRVQAIVFARREDYLAVARQHGQPNSAAFFTRSVNDIDERPTVVTAGELDDAKRELLQHELTHRFLRLQLSDPPVWLNEGLAEYNSTLQLRDGKAWFGRMPRAWQRLFRPGARLPFGSGSGLRWLSVEDLPSVATLLAATPDGFYERIEDNPAPEHPLSYPGAWLLAHLLSAPRTGYRPRLDRLLTLLAHGTGRQEAWARAFAGVSVAELERDYRQHAREVVAGAQQAHDAAGDAWTWFVTTPYQPHAAAAVDGVRPLDDADVRILFAQLQRWKGPGLARAQAELAAARAEAPDRAEVRYWSGLIARAAGDDAAAERELRAAAAAAPNEALYRQALLLPRLATVPDDATLETLAPDAQKLARVAHTPLALALVGEYFGVRRQPDVGLPFALRAVRADPACYVCFDVLAQLDFARGALADAVTAEERALGLLPEGAHVDAFTSRLARYRAAAAAMPSPPPAAPGEGPATPTP